MVATIKNVVANGIEIHQHSKNHCGNNKNKRKNELDSVNNAWIYNNSS